WAPISPAPRKWIGSNNWVVNGEWTKSGKPMLANDPHLGLTTPSIWYLAHFNINGKNLLGSTLPAVPFVVLGRNDRIAWGFTNTNPDVQDLYIERLVDDSSYLTVDGPVVFETREEIIKVKGGEDVVLNVRESRHGPIMSDVSKDMQMLLDNRHVMAFHWTALEDADTSASAGRQIVNSHDYQSLLKALMGFHAPEQNIVYADVDGNIGYIAPGKVPVRDPESPTQGLLPARGWLGTDEWIDRIPFEELPQTYNPPSGMVYTANQKIVRDDYPYHITDDWALPYRANRIAKRLISSTQHDAESFIDIQMDPATDMAVELSKIMLAIGDFGGKHQELRDALAKWDGGMWRDDAEPLIYAAWHRAIAKHIYEDDLKDRFSRYWDIRPDFLLPLFRGAEYGEAWCDDNRTTAVESCATQVAAALDDAVAELTAAHGENWRAWRWGDVHKVTHVHRPFSNVDALKSWFELKDEADGGPYAINVSPLKFASKHPYESTDGPSYRAIYDLANLETSRYIIPGGQSGHFLSPHYGDLAPLWRDGKYIEISTSKEKILDDALGTLTLKAER
ncbi:MAG: penicillin acylase family protein, partial [Sphingomonadales bacterium]